ncbi:MAG: hypothetical protein EOP88_11130 [Verrucomicrobiaceae bacterium]|nr:MAG: hypothetical protein EOP88_11130 [Verrucomicrobiaceae bacterium]
MIRSILIWAVLVLHLTAEPVFRDDAVYPNPVFKLDLDRDGKSDVRVDVSRVKTHPSNPYYLASPLGSASIAGTNGITRSFSNGNRVTLAKLDLKAAPSALRTGGVYRDTAGNFITEGWGGGALVDDAGKILFPEFRRPAHRVDHFLVRLAHGVAWVALDSRPFTHPGARLNVRWAYFENPGESFTIRIKDSHRLVKIKARFTGKTTFTIGAINHSGWMAAIFINHPKIIYKSGGKSVELMLRKEYEFLHPEGLDVSVRFGHMTIWGYSRVKAIYDLDDFVTSRGGKPFHPDVKKGEFWFVTRVNDEMRKIRVEP